MENAGIQPNSFKPPTTESQHRLGYSPNLLLDLPESKGPGRVWVGDITYIPVAALQQSIRSEQPPTALIHHTDRGGQYAGTRYRLMLSRASMRQSMGRAGNCYDNAFMESCFGTLKTEMSMTEYKSMAVAKRELFEYIEYYDTQRRHSSLC